MLSVSFFCVGLASAQENTGKSVISGVISPGSKEASPALQKDDFRFAVLKYSGGGDWYEGRVGVKELMNFIAGHNIIEVKKQPVVLEIQSFDFFEYPLIYATGHGGFILKEAEVQRLRRYLLEGGMLLINDDYGLDPFVQREMKRVFPNRQLKPLPLSHEIFNIYYSFLNGVPKIHKHDGGRGEIYAIFQAGKIAVLYIKNTDIGDGWAPYQVHKDPISVRKEALKFGMNVVLYALTR